MYHSVAGRKLVAAVNRAQGTSYSAREFFDDVYFPLFFGRATDGRYLLNVNNSPVDQAFKQKTKKPLTLERLEECRQQIHRKVADEIPDASFFLGGAAAGAVSSTSGQVTGLPLNVTSDDIYASWLGAALGVTVDGGLSLLFDSEEILLTLLDGWQCYRQYLDDTPSIKPMQVNTWNGQWLTAKLGRDWIDGMHYVPRTENGQITTQSWPQLMFSLANHYPASSLRAYIYSFGQTNRTIGFIRIELPQVSSLSGVYRELFETPSGIPVTRFENLYATERSFLAGCQQTLLGLKALKPKDVFHVERGELPKLEGDKLLSALTYKTWIIAMLNNKELMDRARALAEVLYNFNRSEGRGKSVHSNLVEERLLKASRVNAVIEVLTEIMERDSVESLPIFRQAITDLLNMPAVNVPLYLALLRFEYAATKKESK